MMAEKSLFEALELLDFDTQLPESNLLFTNREYTPNEISFGERLILSTAAKLSATAVFFRRFADNQASVPQIFIFDNTSEKFSEAELADLHRKIWSGSMVPLYYVISNTEIKIFDGRTPVAFNKSDGSISSSAIDALPLVAESYQLYKRYSANLFINGAFWDLAENRNHFLSKESVEKKLIGGLKRIRSHFLNKTRLEELIANKLLVLAILIKYLEERKDEQNNPVFPNDFFDAYNNARSFCEVIREGKTVPLFEDLSEHFNGKIFELTQKDKEQLENEDLSLLADYLDANIELEERQLVLWRMYSFEHLPVELISRIYEEFIPERSDAVYTPLHLAKLMVDECMPIEEPKEDFKVIDVSCGSGVFLVTVFKRLVQWWQKKQYDRTGQIQKPDVRLLKKILLSSIYGVDIEPESVRLSVFSLSLALCDMLTPTEIWTELQFEDLKKENIYEGDFFQFLRETEKGRFDLVIGNPPFEDKLKDFNTLYEQYEIAKDFHIPRHQIAMLFLQQAMKLLKPEVGLLSFVMPSGPLLYNNTINFRRDFFSRYKIPQILDFSLLDKKSFLFERSVSTAVIFAYNRKPLEDSFLWHIVFRRTRSAQEKLFFELDYYDFHQVSMSDAISESKVWKANLLGGGILFNLLKRLSKLQTLGDFLRMKKKLSGWYYGEGYNVGNRSKPAIHLTGKSLVPTEKFTEKGIEEIIIETEVLFEGVREKNKKIFCQPHLLIKETPGRSKFITAYLKEDLIFKHEIIGIHAPVGEEEDLLKVERILQENYSLYKMLLLSLSGRAGISRSNATVLLKDFLRLPFSTERSTIKLNVNEEIVKNDTLNYRLEELSKGLNSPVNTEDASPKKIKDFGQVFCESLNNIYQTNDKKFNPLDVIQTESYICFPFSYGGAILSKDISSKIRKGDFSELIENKTDSIHYKRVLRLYQKDLIFLIKPKTLRYWLKSVALRDASDVMVDLVNSGY